MNKKKEKVRKESRNNITEPYLDTYWKVDPIPDHREECPHGLLFVP
jgi:hypothetical protein